MLKHKTEPSTISNVLLQREDYYYCSECAIHFAAPPKFCWFCGIRFKNADSYKKIFPRDNNS